MDNGIWVTAFSGGPAILTLAAYSADNRMLWVMQAEHSGMKTVKFEPPDTLPDSVKWKVFLFSEGDYVPLCAAWPG